MATTFRKPAKEVGQRRFNAGKLVGHPCPAAGCRGTLRFCTLDDWYLARCDACGFEVCDEREIDAHGGKLLERAALSAERPA